MPDKPLIVQGDGTLLSEVASPQHPALRDKLSRFAELVKAPEHMHTWRLTPLSIWNAAAAGMTAGEMCAVLTDHSRYPIPAHLLREVAELTERYGLLQIRRLDDRLLLTARTDALADALWARDGIKKLLGSRLGTRSFQLPDQARGRLKQALIKIGHPTEDLAGYTPGAPLAITLRDASLSGGAFSLRPYQELAVGAFHAAGDARGGSGVVVLPCGAGKTVVGMGVMAATACDTLILAPSTTAVRQWKDELLDKTWLTADQIGTYTSTDKTLRPVTITTYQMITHRPKKDGPFPHFPIFNQRNWGLIIYDEVHLLPAPIFQVTADIQARRRLGLTATLVREDNRQDEVFALVGPKKYDVPWKMMESQGWIARATCGEIRVPMPANAWKTYITTPARKQPQIAAANPDKLPLIRSLLARHRGTPALVIGTYVDQLDQIAAAIQAPLLTGRTGKKKRQQLYQDFRAGKLPTLVVSKVANFAVDLPDAGLAIQVSGSFGSRQEEAQRLGRLLRPKSGENRAWFYSLVSADTVEQEFAHRRQLFLIEQGYTYTIEDA